MLMILDGLRPERDPRRQAIETLKRLLVLMILHGLRPERDLGRKAIETGG